MQFNESFNQHRLNYILQNKEKFTFRIYEQSYDPFNAAQKLLNKSTDGLVRVDYHQPGNRNFGRFFADGGVSLQSICREIRHSIAAEYYDDLDVVNAHPVILRFLCQLHNIDHDKLNEYIENRDQHLTELVADNNIDRDTAKMVFLSLINGGAGDYSTLAKPTRFIRRFKAETADILQELCELYPEEYEIRKKSNPDNPMGSTVNALMCDWENKILQCILKFYQDKDIIKDNCVLSFDGIMILKHDQIANLITECEAYILEKTKIAVSLKIKPMDQGFDLPNVVDEYSEYKPFDPRDDFCWLEFDEKYRGKTFTSQDEILEKTRSDLNRVFCKVEQGGGFIVKKTDCKDNLMDILDTRSAFTDLYFKYFEDQKPKEMSFKRYLQVFSNNMNRYRSIDFAPNNPDPKLFNLWSGFEAQMILEDEKTLDIAPIQLILDHIREIYCNGCEESYEYFLDLLYFIIKYPEKPLGVATFIYSKNQGSGKNIILDFLQEFVFGNNISYYTTGLETVLEKHNHLLKNKKIVIVDELASSSDNFVGNFDKLKSMMTGPFISINPKGVNQYSIKNVLGWFLISNHDDCIRLEPSDRRYFCLSVSEKYIGDKPYFKKLAETFTSEAGNTFFTYIMHRGNNRDVNIRVPPMNAFKKSIINKGWSTSIRYLFEIKDKEYDEAEETEIKGTELFENYKDWCRATNHKAKTKTNFESNITDHIDKRRRAAGMYYDLKSIKI
jgi:hypothetical protein